VQLKTRAKHLQGKYIIHYILSLLWSCIISAKVAAKLAYRPSAKLANRHAQLVDLGIDHRAGQQACSRSSLNRQSLPLKVSMTADRLVHALDAKDWHAF
jgi:hypothetical protein